jgi:hypothetical protein
VRVSLVVLLNSCLSSCDFSAVQLMKFYGEPLLWRGKHMWIHWIAWFVKSVNSGGIH